MKARNRLWVVMWTSTITKVGGQVNDDNFIVVSINETICHACKWGWWDREVIYGEDLWSQISLTVVLEILMVAQEVL